MDFKFPNKLTGMTEKDVPILQRMFSYLEETFQTKVPRVVTYSSSMNDDIGANYNEIVFCSTDNKFYGCVTPGPAGSATWAALN